ncbi:RSC complex protein [Epithele typhae]|uniref:RSC complex protein n=1 Tax=Epithele typhae TaxID=378194 RepID=UPI00200856B2|nr:RSC complex protein [Epithele typhae]KAH9932045.1 RSC complex protein [Epithele typhae]
MSKRETRSFAASGVDVDAPRAKRRKEASATSTSGTSITIKPLVNASPIGDAPAGDESGASPVEDPAVVKEKGLGVWNTLKDAVNKDGQIASFQFMRLPSRRQYADYYNIIKHPIALDDIKSKLERREFDTCFRNAKRYNMRESQIWKDAKFLHKLSAKELDKLTGKEDRDGEGSDDDGEKKKAPSMYRLLKSRLQKLVDKKETIHGSSQSQLWPMYYQIIKKPQCLDNIFKRLKQKEYPTPKDFANDHTPIWEDAVVLREHFRKLMSDLPEPYTIPTYENPAPPPPPPQPVAAPTPSLPSSNSIPQRHRRSTLYIARGARRRHRACGPDSAARPRPVFGASPHFCATSRGAAAPPVAETVFAHPLRRVVITTLPLYRRLVLDHGDGVRTWAMRLDGSEATVVVSDVAFIEKDKTRAREEDDGDSSADEAHPRREEEEEEEADERERSSSSPSRRRTRSPRKRGRPARTAKKTQQSPGKGKAAETPRGETEVKLNGVSVTERDAGTWEVLVGVGSSILEVGEKGGMMWKVYLDRSLVQ